MSFNHVKTSQAFNKKSRPFDVTLANTGDVELDKWLSSTRDLSAKGARAAKHSEDGWSGKKFSSFKQRQEDQQAGLY